ncbi:hypothetical protein GCM10023193_75250 [Planotetraspora kaengkrachanensis]|uniref:Uncharacterized protein n=1 Tax=Planotetraspora kaengkrachanensis TaxID=575193 RepID=A0A8J3PTR1_9ACTN|nr:hypothetical protein Pka01_39880 [Planotetraspora kaengkrachanensis]
MAVNWRGPTDLVERLPQPLERQVRNRRLMELGQHENEVLAVEAQTSRSRLPLHCVRAAVVEAAPAVSDVIRWQLDPDRRAVRPEDRKPRGSNFITS